MTDHKVFYYPYLYFDKLGMLDPVRAGWNTAGAKHHAYEGNFSSI